MPKPQVQDGGTQTEKDKEPTQYMNITPTETVSSSDTEERGHEQRKEEERLQFFQQPKKNSKARSYSIAKSSNSNKI